MYSRLSDYAQIGNFGTRTLTGTHGAVDWLCSPCMDSGGCLTVLLSERDCDRRDAPPWGAASVPRRSIGAMRVLDRPEMPRTWRQDDEGREDAGR